MVKSIHYKMRVLWFPGNGAIYAADNKYNGGGWTGALARELMTKHPEIELGMAIPWHSALKDDMNGVAIYGIPTIKHAVVNYQKKLDSQIEIIRRIVEDFQPDLIHVFGSEHTGGMVATVTDIPVVLHLQGILNFLGGAWLPQNLSWEKYIMMHPMRLREKMGLERGCRTEMQILQSCHHFMGRTEMDRRVSSILSPGSKYYYCSEMLRPVIYGSDKLWSYHQRNKRVITSVISSPIYKGGDVVLRAAKVLKECLRLDFEWRVYGVKNMKVWERLCGIKTTDVNVTVCGVVNAEGLVEAISDSDVFVHPSYIENSPNTVCEAQVLGIPVIANDVGGTSSLITHQETGILLPANDPYMTASYVVELCSDEAKAKRIGEGGRTVALKRHHPDSIVKDVLNIYKRIIGE